MEQRALGKTGWSVSEPGFGALAIGGDAWGATEEGASLSALHAALDAGVDFIDIADVHGERPGRRSLRNLETGVVDLFNVFRSKPAERFLALARERAVGIIARVPLVPDGATLAQFALRWIHRRW